MSQPCLEGFRCRDMILRVEADRYSLGPDSACDPNDPLCGNPSTNEITLYQWAECADDSLLDFSQEQNLPGLPPCIINLQARESASGKKHPPVLAAKLTDIGGVLSYDPYKLATWRPRHAIGKHTLLLAHQESRDAKQERLFRWLNEDGCFRHLGLLSEFIFVAPGLSVYDDGTMCPLRQILNMRLSLRLAARANRCGVKSVPVFGWNHNRSTDIEFLAGWCSRQGDLLKVIAVNAQTGSLSRELTNLAAGMLEIERLANREYQWIVFGGRRRIEYLSEKLPRNRLVQIAREKDFQIPATGRRGSHFVQYLLA